LAALGIQAPATSAQDANTSANNPIADATSFTIKNEHTGKAFNKPFAGSLRPDGDLSKSSLHREVSAC
jgi:hypothetical protein